MKQKHKQNKPQVRPTTGAPRILIAIPCMDQGPAKFWTSLVNLRKTADTHYGVKANSMIYDSRNNFAAHAIMSGYDRVLWLDSDMTFEPDLLERLNADMDGNGLDYVAGIFFKRRMPTGPCIYKDLIYGLKDDGTIRAEAIPYKDYPKDTLFQCAGTGFGAVLVKTELMKAVWETYGPPFQPMPQMGEDLSFCYRVTELGRTMWCDSRVKVGHIGEYVFGEQTYLAQPNDTDQDENGDGSQGDAVHGGTDTSELDGDAD